MPQTRKRSRETQFVNWSDDRLTVIYRDINTDGELSEYVETHSYPADEVDKLRAELLKQRC